MLARRVCAPRPPRTGARPSLASRSPLRSPSPTPSPLLIHRLVSPPTRLYAAKPISRAPPSGGTMQVPIAATAQSFSLPAQTPEEMEQEQRSASQLRSVLEARLKDVHEGKLSPGQAPFYQLYRSVVSYPRWLVPGSLHRDRSINTLFTFSRSDRDRGILPIFSHRGEFNKFVELMRNTGSANAQPRTKAYQAECFAMSGALLFAQLALAAHRTNLERIVVDITVAPAFSIGKDKLETWREWAETVSLEQILARLSQHSVTRDELERALAAMLQFRHFIAVKSVSSDRLVRANVEQRQGGYLSLFTALDQVPLVFHDRTRYQLVRAPARQALESCSKHGDAGVVLNLPDTDVSAAAASASALALPLAVLSVRDGKASSIQSLEPNVRWSHILDKTP